MYHIAYKNSDKKVICLRETVEQCWMTAKGMDSDAFNTWKESELRGEDGKVTYPSADFTVVRIDQNLKSPVSEDEGAKTYNDYIIKRNDVHLKWNATKKELEPDDSSLEAAELAEEWRIIRAERDRLLAETDWMANSDVTMSAANKTYRQKLRDLPSDQSSKKTFADITWPTKP